LARRRLSFCLGRRERAQLPPHDGASVQGCSAIAWRERQKGSMLAPLRRPNHSDVLATPAHPVIVDASGGKLG
jgi:hypothetical protein